MATCNACGHENPEGARFCSACGSPLDGRSSMDDPTALHTSILGSDVLHDMPAVEDLPDTAVAALVIRQGAKKGSRIALDGTNTEVSIGRHPESSVFLDDVTVSRRHAVVQMVEEQGGFVVRDVGSLNGTYVNQERVEEQLLVSGDEVQVGKFKLVFVAVGSLN